MSLFKKVIKPNIKTTLRGLSGCLAGFFIFFSPPCIALSEVINKPRMQAINLPYPVKNTINKTYTFHQMGWDKSVTLNGYTPSTSFYIPIAKNLHVQQAILHLKMVYSPQATPPTLVDITLNHAFVQRLPMPDSKHNEVSWDIALPLDKLSETWQEMSFSAYFSSTHSLCSPDIWIYILPESSLTLSYPEPHFYAKLNQLPYPFVNPTALDATPTLMVLPTAPSMQEIISSFQVAQRLGEVSGDYKVQVSSEFIDTLEDHQKKQNNLLLIGLASHILEQEQVAYPWPYVEKNQEFIGARHMPLKNNPGLIMLAPSPWNPNYGIMSITGTDNISLKKAVSAFTLSEFKSLSDGQVAIIDTIRINPEPADSIDWHHTTFKEMGYADKSVAGLGKHTLSYSLLMPNNLLPTNLKIITWLTHPLFHDNDRSQITLFINHVKQSSLWLSHDASSWRVKIPDDALKPGANRLDYIIDLHLADERCNRQNYEQAWATIHAESIVETSFQNRFPQATLSEFPVPFGPDFTVVLPSTLSQNDIKQLTKLFFNLGVIYQDKPQQIDIRASDQVDESFIRQHNTILIGTPTSNPWVKSLLNDVPVAINDHERIFNSANTFIKMTDTSSVGLLELVQSPWNEHYAMLLVTGNNDKGLSSAIETFMDNKKRQTLDGNIAIINADQSIETLNKYGNRYLNFIPRFIHKSIHYSKKVIYFIEDSPQIVIYVLVFIIPIIIYFRRRNKH